MANRELGGDSKFEKAREKIKGNPVLVGEKMSERIIYLNGDYLSEKEAKLPVLDRGLLFADAVYEGFGILDGQIVDFIYHMQRLERSLSELSIPMTFSIDEMFHDLMGLIEKNNAQSGFCIFMSRVVPVIGHSITMINMCQISLHLSKAKNLLLTMHATSNRITDLS